MGDSETGKRQMDNKQETYRYVQGDGGGDLDGVARGSLSKGLTFSTGCSMRRSQPSKRQEASFPQGQSVVRYRTWRKSAAEGTARG